MSVINRVDTARHLLLELKVSPSTSFSSWTVLGIKLGALQIHAAVL